MRFYYHGDINAENGGYFASTANVHYDYADAVRITPHSDAGGADNEFWIETLTVNLPTDDETVKQVLSTCGWLPAELPKARGARARMLIDACIAYGKYDITHTEQVRIGKKDEYAREHFERVDVQLRGGSDIGRYAHRKTRTC